MKPKCPYCDKIQTKKPQKTWKYGWGKVKVSKFCCDCTESFNYYQSSKGDWTIPKKGQTKPKKEKINPFTW